MGLRTTLVLVGIVSDYILYLLEVGIMKFPSIVSTDKSAAVAPVARFNVSLLTDYVLRTHKDLDTNSVAITETCSLFLYIEVVAPQLID